MIETFTLLGSIAGIAGWLLPGSDWKDKATHALYGVIIAALSVGFVDYKNQLNKVYEVERVAAQLLEDRRTSFTDAGYVQAVLTVLEKYKDIYPDTYIRAKEICEAHDCNRSRYKNIDGVEGLNHSWGLTDLASQMDGILKGLIAANKSDS